YREATHPGFSTAAPSNVVTPSGSNWSSVSCPPSRTIPGTISGGNNVVVATEIVTNLTENTSICRSLTISPASTSGGSDVGQACVHVAAKPFVSVRGGDITA